jgi:hypothetical protein
MLFPMLTSEWLHLVCTVLLSKYHNSRLNIIILFWNIDIRSAAWLNLFWEYINGKLFVVQHVLD